MPGFEHYAMRDISQIRNDLDDRYQEGFPIIKELLQNADDAEASCLHIGWFPGFPELSHPLLTGPALFIVNDGEFKNEDQRSIRRIGISAKASKQSTIGKFGLGLKSVFHWCEAFFYFWSEQDTFEILNPWAGKPAPNHNDWEWEDRPSIPREARQAIVHCLESATLLNCSDWFGLWIPLRQQRHCGELAPIIEKFPGDGNSDGNIPPESIFLPNLAHNISKTLPLLRDLKTVSAWSADETDRMEMLFEVNLEEDATRCRYRGSEQGISTTDYGHQLPLQGIVKVTDESCPYAGFEMMVDGPIFRELYESEGWPTVGTIDSKTGAEREDKEKADSHCAAYFVETPTEDGGSLRIQRAVFLPVGDATETRPCAGKSDFTLMLHGYFFPDTGRTGVEIRDDINDGTDVRSKWNRQLAFHGTLPLVVPALERFVKEGKLSEERVRRLTEALEKSDTFDRCRQSICRDNQWVRRLKASCPVWEQLDNPDEEILEIPTPPNSTPNRPYEVFPNLGEIAGVHVITFRGDPRLTTRKKASKWPVELLTQMLDISVEPVFGNREMLKYLVDFLKAYAKDTKFDASNVLQRLMRKALNTVALEQFRANRSEIKNFLALISSNSCFPISKSISEEVFRGLFQLKLHVLLVPEDLMPDDHSTQSLCNEDAVQILKFLSTLGEKEEYVNPKSTLVQKVIAASNWDALQTQCHALEIFVAHDYRIKSNVFLSLSQLTELRGKGRLFSHSSSHENPQATNFQQALNKDTITLINDVTQKVLGWDDDVGRCDELACLEALTSKPALNDPKERVKLLDALLPKFGRNPEHQQAVRYLIHAHLSDTSRFPLFLKIGGKQELWGKIAIQILQQKNEGWRVIPDVLGLRISLRYWEPLAIHQFDAKGIAQLIQEVGAEHVDCTVFSTNDRQQILEDIDVKVLPELNIYDDVDGNLVRINPDRTYWADQFPWEDIPRANITILRPLPESVRWKQERLLDRVFDAEAAIEVLLESENPHLYWSQILDALGNLKNAPYEINKELRAVKWLPIDAGRSPQDVIFLKGMEDVVARIVAQSDDFVDVSRLPEEFRRHPGFEIMVREICPQRDDALAMLGELMAEAEQYHIGDIDTADLDVETFLSTFKAAPPQLMPAHSMIHHVRETFDVAVCREHLLPELCQKLSRAHTVEILNFLSKCHQDASKNRKQGILDIFNRYLKTAVKESQFSEILGQIRLLSRDGNWKGADELCLDSDGTQGIQTDDLLHEEQTDALRNSVLNHIAPDINQLRESANLQGSADQQFVESVTRLKQYFEPWEGTVRREVIGGLLALLGNHGELLNLSDDYLGNRTVDGYRERLDWKVTPSVSAAGANEDIHTAMHKQRFLVEVVEGKTIEVTNLLGSPFNARVEQEGFETLFIGSTNKPSWEQFPHEHGMEYRVNWIRLRSVQPDGFKPDHLRELIKTSARLLLEKVYKREVSDLDEVFDDLAKSEQLDIQIAQNLLLGSVFFYVQQLDMRKEDSKLSETLKLWDEARRRKTEAELNNDTKAEQAETVALQGEQEELKNLLQNDPTTQESLLTAVRRKIGGHYQYTPQSIPFELFQNADDAVVEWFEMHDNPPPEEPTDTTRFVVHQAGDHIAFIHWGRAINKYGSTQFNGRERGFDRDLEKMLILSASDKSESAETVTVTGRFGLGFKSVFLVTSNPCVASGRLGFEVMGGFFPKPLTGDALKALHKQIEACKIDGKEGTIVSIQAEACAAKECLEDFLNLGYLIPVFARKIKRCDLIRDDKTETRAWSERLLGGSKRVYVGELQPSSDAQRQTAAVFRACQGALLVGFDAHGAVKLDKTVPTVWVTVPTKERLYLGFIVNANFELDIGRAQLASDSETNRNVADEVGVEIGDALIELFDEASRDWDNFCDHLNLARGTEPYPFWGSLWELLARGIQEQAMNTGEAGQLIRQTLWNSRNHGMGKLLYSRPAMPSGLWGDYKTLVQADQVQFKTVGVLDTESVFCHASQWPQFQQRIQPGQVVSEGQVASVITRLLPDELLNHQDVKLCSLVQWELEPDHFVKPSQASQLGALITREFLDELNRGDQKQRSEHTELVELLKGLRFQGRDGKYHIAVDLLITAENADNPDEPLRAAFAPADRLLTDDYTGVALEFFKACRSELSAPAQLMATWALGAPDDKRHAVLQYICKGQLEREVASEIRKRIQGTWLSELKESQLLLQHSDSDQQVILGRLELNEKSTRSIIEGIGMETAMRYERDKGRTPEDVSDKNRGFDIRSTDSAGVERYIEVKARSEFGGVALTQNEWDQAEQLGVDYFLYVILNAGTEPKHYIIENPAERTHPEEQMGYRISLNEIKGKGLKV